MTRGDLEYIRILNDKINGKLLRIAELKSQALPGAIRYDDTGGSKPTVFDSLGDLYAEIDIQERIVNRLIDKRYTLKTQAIRVIRLSCDDVKERHVLYLRYLGTIPRTSINLEWPEVRKYMRERHNIQDRRIYELHHLALQNVKPYKI